MREKTVPRRGRFSVHYGPLGLYLKAAPDPGLEPMIARALAASSLANCREGSDLYEDDWIVLETAREIAAAIRCRFMLVPLEIGEGDEISLRAPPAAGMERIDGDPRIERMAEVIFRAQERIDPSDPTGNGDVALWSDLTNYGREFYRYPIRELLRQCGDELIECVAEDMP